MTRFVNSSMNELIVVISILEIDVVFHLSIALGHIAHSRCTLDTSKLSTCGRSRERGVELVSIVCLMLVDPHFVATATRLRG